MLSLKTRFLNVLRKPLRHPVFEPTLLRLVRGQDPTSLFARVLPRSFQYEFGTTRSVERYGITWPALDLSDSMAWYLFYALHDPSHETFLSLVEPGATVLDVGANIGITALRAAKRVGEHGRVIAFEPDPNNFEKLGAAVAANPDLHVEIHRLAISDAPGELRIEVRDPNNLGMNRVSKSGTVRVDATTIDDFVASAKLDRVDVVKVDVEGFEPSVLRGAAATIARFVPRLFLELDDGNLRDQGSSAREMLGQLDALGYDCRRDDGGPLGPGGPAHDVHTDLVCMPR